MTDVPLLQNRTQLVQSLREKVRVSVSYAHDLATGKRVPSLVLATQIERDLGIPASAWIAHKASCEAERAAHRAA